MKPGKERRDVGQDALLTLSVQGGGVSRILKSLVPGSPQLLLVPAGGRALLLFKVGGALRLLGFFP